jgi:GGDEF domain-containing protein
VARDILRAISSSAPIQGLVLRASASIGIAVYPEDGTSCRSLERRADEAMYSAKRFGGGCFCCASGPRTVPVPRAASGQRVSS